MNRSSYQNISQFGSNAYSPINNPLTYCLNSTMDQRFLHGGFADTLGQYSKKCQFYLSDYCAEGWDGFCEIASRNTNRNYPIITQSYQQAGLVTHMGLTAGESLIHNTAAKKYLTKMANCERKYESFDPTVATSPMISYWVPTKGRGGCIPVYEVDPNTIDDDIVMNKILRKPNIAIGILTNIYNTMKRKGTLSQLKGTKLGMFYEQHPYFKQKGGI